MKLLILYRFKKGDWVTADNPFNIVAIVQREPSAIQSWLDKTMGKRTLYSYCITAVDRGHDESLLSPAITVTTRGKKAPLKIVTKPR